MAKTKLKPKEHEFVSTYVETNNGTKAVQEVYGIEDPNYAGVKAHRLLSNDKIQEAIADALPDEDLARKHNELLNAVVFDRISFKLDDSDELIRDIIAKMPGYEVMYIRQDDNGKMAYVKAPDSNTQDKALDKAYKIKGSYAPDKHVNINANVSIEHKERANTALGHLRG